MDTQQNNLTILAGEGVKAGSLTPWTNTKPAMTISKDGVVSFGDHLTPEEGAEATWNLLVKMTETRRLGETFQNRMFRWLSNTFEEEIIYSTTERADRFLEEALELVQSHGYTKERASVILDFVYDRPAGDPFQEVGGVYTTLSAYCSVHNIDMTLAAETELSRIWQNMDKIREKQKQKPKGEGNV